MSKTQLKLIIVWLLWSLINDFAFGATIGIIESQSAGPGQVMDLEWKNAALAMGHTPIIFPQSALYDLSVLDQTDILIVSAGEIDLTIPQVTTNIEYIKLGRSVYLQTEHNQDRTTNQAFKFLVNSIGGNFEWTKHVEGDLKNVKVLGSYESTEKKVKKIKWLWYGAAGGVDCRFKKILEYKGYFLGFQFIPLNNRFGSLMTTSDKDWIIQLNNSATDINNLLQNFITHLIIPPVIEEVLTRIDLGESVILCKGDSLILNAYVEGGQYTWQDGSTNSTLKVSESGKYSVTVDTYCGQSFGDINVDFLDEPIIELCCDTFLCQGESIILNAYSLNGKYFWNNGSTDSTLEVTTEGNYSVEVDNGCGFDTASTYIYNNDCQCNLFIPNVFSPNDDGINDEFIPTSNCEMLDFYLTINDRWGNQVYESTDNLRPWDGSVVNTEGRRNSGVYSYFLNFKYSSTNVITKHGTITLIH